MPAFAGGDPRRQGVGDGVGHERAKEVGHRDFDALPEPGAAALLEGEQDVDCRRIGACGDVGDERGRNGRLSDTAERQRQQPRFRQIVEVVPGTPGVRAGRADQPGIPFSQRRRPEPQPFPRAGPQAFDENVGAIDQAEEEVALGRVLEVGAHQGLAGVEHAEEHADAGAKRFLPSLRLTRRGSILTISAPARASISVQSGPGRCWLKSTTFTPESGAAATCPVRAMCPA